MRKIDVEIRAIEGENRCQIYCKNKYILEHIQDVVKSAEHTSIVRNQFTFTAHSKEDLQSYFEDIANAMSEILKKEAAYTFLQRKKRFWVLWTILWGGFDFLVELSHLFAGNHTDAIIAGAVGAAVVLMSLTNYWNVRKIETELTEKGII